MEHADFDFAFHQLENWGYSLKYHQLLIISHYIFGIHWFLQRFLNIFIHLHHLSGAFRLCRGYFWNFCLSSSNFDELGRMRWDRFCVSESSSSNSFSQPWGEKKRSQGILMFKVRVVCSEWLKIYILFPHMQFFLLPLEITSAWPMTFLVSLK